MDTLQMLFQATQTLGANMAGPARAVLHVVDIKVRTGSTIFVLVLLVNNGLWINVHQFFFFLILMLQMPST